MKLQQLIVESLSLSDRHENVLVARSHDIDPELTDTAVRLSTAGGGIISGQGSAIFYEQFKSGTGMIGRSYVTEFDSQGNRALRTHWVLVSSNQLECYHNNPVLIARTLSSGGQWYLRTASLESVLPELEISDYPINPFTFPSYEREVQAALRAIEVHKQVAVIDASRPLDFIGEVLQAYSFSKRVEVNFATNRRIVDETPFTICAYSQGDIQLEHDMSRYGIYPIRLRSKLIPTS